MITLEDIKSQWAEDCKIDNDLLTTNPPEFHNFIANI